MKLCQSYQSQMLEYVYGVLEADVGREFAAHIEQCGSCQEALSRAQRQRELLAAAAILEFPGFHFQLPDPTHLAPSIPLTSRTSPVWVRWSVAAAILLLIGGLGIPAGLQSQQQDRVARAKARVERLDHDLNQLTQQQTKRLDQADRELAAILHDINQIAGEQQKEVNQAWTKVNGQPLTMTITGPKTPDPGAANTYNIQIRSRGPRPMPAEAQVSVRLVDQQEQVVYEVKDVRTKGNYQLTLPRDLPLKPNTELSLEVSARSVTGPQATLKETLSLVAPVYLTHLATDKPMYQPGETVRFRSLTLERFSLRPAQEGLQLLFKLKKPNGQEVELLNCLDQVAHAVGPDGKPIRGIGAGEYAIEATAKGGEYTLIVSEAQSRFLPQERKFIVNQYEKPRLDKKLEFTKKSYGAGETVVAACEVKRAGGGSAVAQKRVDVSVNIDGKIYAADGKEGGPFTLKTDDHGTVNVKFQLPSEIEKGEATVTVTFHDGDVETVVRPIPIVLKKLFVEFFPEGGDLVAGVPNRVYFQARSTLGKPSDLKGRIVDAAGQVLCDVQSLNDPANTGANQGMGVFAFTPLADKKYQLKIDQPIGMEGEYPLPESKPDGVVLTIPKAVTSDREPIAVEVRSAKSDRTLLVGAYCRGRLLAHQRIDVKKGEAGKVELIPENGVGGVYRVTVFEEITRGDRTELTPRAERLVYREPAQRLNLSLSADKQRYVPGDKVTIHCLARDENGHSTPAILMVAVVDRSVLTLADEKNFKSMPTHFLLTTEVRKPEDLEHADFLLSGAQSAHASLDALLGTQGWRRFAEQDPNQFRQQNPDNKDADRLLVLNGQLTPLLTEQATPLDNVAVQRVMDKFKPKLTPLQEKLAQAKETHDAVENDDRAGSEFDRLQAEQAAAQQELQVANASMAQHQSTMRKLTAMVAPALVVALFVGSLVVLVVSNKSSPRLAMAALMVCGVLGIYLLIPETKVREAGERAKNVAAAPDMELLADDAKPMIGLGPRQVDAKAERKMRPQAPALNAVIAPQAADMFKVDDKNLDAGKFKADGKLEKLGQPMMPARDANKKELRRENGLRAVLNQRLRQKEMAADRPMARKPAFAGAAMPAERGVIAGGFWMPAERGAVDRIEQMLPPPLCVVREYAHVHAPMQGTNRERRDFTETLCWQPVLVLPDGRGETTFDLSDSVTTFQVLAAGHTLDGRLATATTDVEARLPLVLEPKVPIEVTSSDKIDIPLTIANNSDSAQALNVQVIPTDLALKGKPQERVVVNADSRVRKLYRFQAKIVEGDVKVQFNGVAENSVGDSVVRTFKVVPDGFPFAGSQSDMLEKVARHDLVLPENWVDGTLKYQVAVYPSTLADLQKGLDALLREPNGCFEQTSTSNYPNLLVLDYLKSTDQARPEVARKAQDLLDKGYQKLTSYECQVQGKNQREGYEWFGGTAPPHEALTAYGLMQFRDMARVHDVDKAMLERTKKYLLSRRDGKGGFQRNPRALDSFGRAPDHITNAYIVWALTESGKDDDIAAELNAVAEKAKTSKDPYFLALVANSLLNRDRSQEAIDVLKQIAALQHKDGHLDAVETSITGSGGRDLQIESTALTLLGWLKAKRPDLFNTNVQSAVKWIGQQRGGYGGFGSTQSTILALKALIAHARDNKKTPEAGELTVFVDDRKVATQAFAANVQEALVLDVPSTALKAGKNNIRVEITGNSVFPYTAAWSYQTLTPASAAHCPVKLATRLSRSGDPTRNGGEPDLQRVVEGESIRLNVTVENVSGKGQGMTTAIVGLPAGLTLPEDMKQLRDLGRLRNEGTQRGVIDFWETRGRELILYWRDLAPGKKIEVNIDLICRVPGEYRGPASRAYLYYNADHKHWVNPLEVVIAPRVND